MQPARIKPHAKEHTNNPVQRPNFRGHAAVRDPRKLSQPPEGESVTTPRKTDPKDQAPRPPEAANSDRTVGTQVADLPRCVRAIKPIGCGCAGQVPRGKILHRHEHACSTSTSRHDTSRHAASCWPRCKSLHLHEHARRTGTHAT